MTIPNNSLTQKMTATYYSSVHCTVTMTRPSQLGWSPLPSAHSRWSCGRSDMNMTA